MKKTKKKQRQNRIRTPMMVFFIGIFIISFLLYVKPLGKYEQVSLKNSNAKPQSANDNPPEQQWNKTWGGDLNDTAINVAVDSADNVYVLGTYDMTIEPITSVSGESFSDNRLNQLLQPPPRENTGDIVLLKYNNLGEVQWEQTWGGSGRDDSRAIVVDSSDNIYVVGSAADGDVVFLKYDSSGELQWDKSWSSLGRASAITLDSEDNIFITGDISGNMILWKFNSLGNEIWERIWDGGSLLDLGWAVEVDSLNNIYVTGLKLDANVGGDLFLVKYDTSGHLQWETSWGGSLFEDAHSIAIDSSDNIFVAGCCLSFGAGKNDLSVVKFNSAGQLQWNKTWGGNESDGGWDMLTLDLAGNIYLGASTSSFGVGLSDGVLVKLNSTGDHQWNTTWGGSETDGFSSIVVDASDNIYLVGTTDSFGGGDKDIVLVKYSQGSDEISFDFFESIVGYNLWFFFGGIGLILIISTIKVKKWHSTQIF
ncbi:MAG: hypothetical protein ACTSRK_11370 [Promethearchaeota archaeon]